MSEMGQKRSSRPRSPTFAVGTRVTSRPPHRSVRAQFGHTACMGLCLSRRHQPKMTGWRMILATMALVVFVSTSFGAMQRFEKPHSRASSTCSATEVKQSAHADTNRVALVIGNFNYPDADTPLAQTGNDACALASALRKDGFDVDLVQNATRNDMQRAIERLKAKVRHDSIVMIYLGGYGVESGGQNYLIPVDAKIWDEQDVRRVGVSADWLFAGPKSSGAHVRLAVIDASRRNPYERRFRSYS